jgi:hypothetical protein
MATCVQQLRKVVDLLPTSLLVPQQRSEPISMQSLDDALTGCQLMTDVKLKVFERMAADPNLSEQQIIDWCSSDGIGRLQYVRSIVISLLSVSNLASVAAPSKE